ncbi:uncharacterized protein grh isoform X3 [Bemisia tabaci]|uniref:uncharacterized protein grh isoform X3 n=1 Tax=Bemisia tabaci TaxID=7038 RepID=UPI003B286819
MEDTRPQEPDNRVSGINEVEGNDVSPLPPAASPVAPAPLAPTSTSNINGPSPVSNDQGPSSPVLLATMTPVEFGKDYEEQTLSVAHSNLPVGDGLDDKNVIYLESGAQGETVIFDASQPLPQGLSIQEANGPNGPISVVVQQPGAPLSLNQAAYQAVPSYQGHPPGATVLVLSELPDDPMAILGPRKRKEGGGGGGGGGAGEVRMAEIPTGAEGVEDGGWRLSSGACYEHPLTAATSAMLNISGASADDPPTTGSMPLIYEYSYLTKLAPDKDKLGDIWPATTVPGGTPGLFTSQLKGTNGVIGGGSLDGAQLTDFPGLFLQHHPVTSIKREPEDLSHRNKQAKGRKVVLVTTSGQPDLVVDVANNSSNNSNNNTNSNSSSNNNNTTVKEEFISSPQHGSRSMNGTPSSTSSLIVPDIGPPSTLELIATPDGLKPANMAYSTHIFTPQSHAGSGTPSPVPYSEHIQYTASVSQGVSAGYITTSTTAPRNTASSFGDPYYRDYFAEQSPYATQIRQQIPAYADSPENAGGLSTATTSFVERYVRQSTYHNSKGVIAAAGLTVDLPSPDSGIGADAITPRDQAAIHQSFDYADMCQPGALMDPAGSRPATAPNHPSGGRSRPWHDFGRQNDADKIQIPKTYSQYGFKYHLETPISTNQRREDDRVTYINKGQFYGITMDYIPDPDKPIKSQTVKSVVMLMFREEKSPEDEIKAWQFWHGRQHSVKQRILDADTKNSVGLVGCIEEVAHNAIAVYWNPLESSAKINVAVQCLSTDFSSQKGVKGLPLHLQIDTYEDPRDGPVFHRGYCQIKVFCDKGAERKTRDEERRAAKRKMTATGRKKIDELYHPPAERSEFYTMSDTTKPPVLFTPAEDIDKLTSMELQGFYGHETDTSSLSNGESGPLKHSPFLVHGAGKIQGSTPTQTLKFHNHFPPDTHSYNFSPCSDKKDLDSGLTTDGNVFTSPPHKRPKIIPPINERVMLYVRQDADDVYTPLHVVPPSVQGLLNADYGQN